MPSLNYLLDDDQGMEVEVAPHRGGMVVGLRWQGQELLYLEKDSYRDLSKNVRGGIPILFPWAGPLPEGSLPGVTAKLPQHGLARQAAWEVVSGGPGARLELSLGANSSDHELFPWDFETRCSYRLEPPGTLVIEQWFHNRSQRPMPFQVGLHPYFRVGPKSRLSFELPVESYRDNEDRSAPERPFAGLDLELPVLDWELRGVRGDRAALVDPGRGVRIELHWSDPYRYLVVWSLKGKDFCCLEPWSAPRFALQSGEDVVTLPPGASRTATVSIRVSSP